MKFDNLPYRCKFCHHLRAVSLYMDGKHEYACSKYPVGKEKSEENCPHFEGELPTETHAKKPITKTQHGQSPDLKRWCPSCNERLYRRTDKCPNCGQIIIWR